MFDPSLIFLLIGYSLSVVHRILRFDLFCKIEVSPVISPSGRREGSFHGQARESLRSGLRRLAAAVWPCRLLKSTRVIVNCWRRAKRPTTDGEKSGLHRDRAARHDLASRCQRPAISRRQTTSTTGRTGPRATIFADSLVGRTSLERQRSLWSLRINCAANAARCRSTNFLPRQAVVRLCRDPLVRLRQRRTAHLAKWGTVRAADAPFPRTGTACTAILSADRFSAAAPP